MSKGKILQFFHKDAKKLNTISDDTIPLPDIHSKKSKAGTQTNVHTHVPGSRTHSSQKAGQKTAAHTVLYRRYWEAGEGGWGGAVQRHQVPAWAP